MNKEKIAIFGSGSILTQELVNLLEDEYEISVIFSGTQSEVKSSKIKTDFLLDVFKKDLKFDYVIIVSAYIPSTEINNRKLFEVNVDLVEKITEKFSDSKIIFCSTISIYAPQENQLLQESTCLLPQSQYAISKLWAEKVITGKTSNYVILRIASLVGSGMKENTFIPMLLNKALTNKEIVVYGNGKRLQNYIHVSDLAQMIHYSIKFDVNGVLLGVNTESYSNLQIAQEIQKLMPDVNIRFSGKDDSLNYCFDAKKTYEKLNFVPQKKIKKIIQELVEWKIKQY